MAFGDEDGLFELQKHIDHVSESPSIQKALKPAVYIASKLIYVWFHAMGVLGGILALVFVSYPFFDLPSFIHLVQGLGIPLNPQLYVIWTAIFIGFPYKLLYDVRAKLIQWFTTDNTVGKKSFWVMSALAALFAVVLPVFAEWMIRTNPQHLNSIWNHKQTVVRIYDDLRGGDDLSRQIKEAFRYKGTNLVMGPGAVPYAKQKEFDLKMTAALGAAIEKERTLRTQLFGQPFAGLPGIVNPSNGRPTVQAPYYLVGEWFAQNKPAIMAALREKHKALYHNPAFFATLF